MSYCVGLIVPSIFAVPASPLGRVDCNPAEDGARAGTPIPPLVRVGLMVPLGKTGPTRSSATFIKSGKISLPASTIVAGGGV